MIPTNPAFELLRRHKEVKHETESLVLKLSRGKVTNDELLAIFENGIAGQYGKIYSLDPQTLMSWVNAYIKTKNSDKNYLHTGLTPLSTPSYETIEWDKEANKCFAAFVSGVNESQFHPAVYDRMMCDGKIPINSCMDYMSKGFDVVKAKQNVLRETFLNYKQHGYTCVYFIKN